MKLPLALCILLPAAAAAQGGPPKPAASLGASFSYSAPEGFISRRAGVSGEAALGKTAGFDLRAAADLEHLRNFSDGYFPGELFKTGLKLTAEKGEARLALSLNSNSDRPFHSRSETDLGLTCIALLSESNGSAWLWGLNYSSRRPFLRGIPLPFITYRYTSRTLIAALPFMLRWQASKTIALSASYQPVKYFKAGLNWRPLPFFRAEIEGGKALEQFLPAGRKDKSQALYYEASYISLRPSLSFSRAFELTPALGWQFSGLYYTGAHYDDYKARTRLRGGPTLGLSAKHNF